MFYWLASGLVWLLLRLLTRCEVLGVENVPRKGPVIIVSNHLSMVDPPVLGALTPRKIIFMGKEELFQRPVLNWLMHGYEAFPVRRGEPDRQALRKSHRVLREGLALGLFPEGTRSRSGALQRGHPGAALLALESGAPIVPVAVMGTSEVARWPGILRRRTIRVVYGEPFYVSTPTPGPERVSGRRRLGEVTDLIMAKVAALLPADRRGVYGQ